VLAVRSLRRIFGPLFVAKKTGGDGHAQTGQRGDEREWLDA
jgi:hypothetical protein